MSHLHSFIWDTVFFIVSTQPTIIKNNFLIEHVNVSYFVIPGNTKDNDEKLGLSTDSLSLGDLSALVQNNYNEWYNISQENEKLKQELQTYKHLCSSQVWSNIICVLHYIIINSIFRNLKLRQSRKILISTCHQYHNSWRFFRNLWRNVKNSSRKPSRRRIRFVENYEL